MPSIRPSLPALLPAALVLALALIVDPATAQRRTPRPPPPPTACTDFYAFSNAAWLQAHPLNAGSESVSRWAELQAQARLQRLALFEQPPTAGPASQRLALWMGTMTDEAAIEAAGLGPVKPLLDRIARLRRNSEIAALLSVLHDADIALLVDVRRDGEAWTLVPGATGMADAGFYRNDPGLRVAQDGYRAYLRRLLGLAGTPANRLDAAVAGAYAIDAQLAGLAGNDAATLPGRELARRYPRLGLAAIADQHGSPPDELAIASATDFQALNTLVERTPIEQWKAWLTARVLDAAAPALPRELREAYHGFHDLLLAGAPRLPTRREWAMLQVETLAPALVETAYVEAYLPAERRQRAEAVVAAVRASMQRAIERAGWLSPAGKALAQQRLAAVQVLLADPGLAPAFERLGLEPGRPVRNLLELRRWGARRGSVAHWPFLPSRPLVALERGGTRIVLSAALLQEPVLPMQPGPADYGAFGALFAQSLAQAIPPFEGADASAWWARRAPLIAQYSGYVAAGTHKVNGEKTLAQNAADLAGIELAWDAFASSNPDPAAKQGFFAAWAALWARQDRDNSLIASLASAEHAPARWRVNGPLSQLPAFAETYDCRASQPMRPRAQTALWR
jgi:putative endopeptidase